MASQRFRLTHCVGFVLVLFCSEAIGQYSIQEVYRDGDVVDEVSIVEMFGETPLSINDNGDIAFLARIDDGLGLFAEDDILFRTDRNRFAGLPISRIDEDDDYYTYRLTNDGKVAFGYSAGRDRGDPVNRMVSFDGTLLARNAGSIDGFDFSSPLTDVDQIDGEAVFAAIGAEGIGLFSQDSVITILGPNVENEPLLGTQEAAFRFNRLGDIAYNANATNLVVNDRIVTRLGADLQGSIVSGPPIPLAIDDAGDVLFHTNRDIFSLDRGRIVGVGDEVDGRVLTRIQEIAASDVDRFAFVGEFSTDEFGGRDWGLFNEHGFVFGQGSEIGDEVIKDWFNGPGVNAHGEVAMTTYLESGVTAVIQVSPLTPGDANGDNRVDSVDLNVLGINWQMDGLDWQDGDFNRDGKVNAVDLNLLGINWQSGTDEPAAVPEPHGFALILCASLFILLKRKHR